MNPSKLLCILLLTTSVTVASHAQDDGVDIDEFLEEDMDSENGIDINDPLEDVNRVIFKFNDGLYTSIVKPFSRTYARVMPDPVERSIGNFFENIKFPSRFVSNVMQGRFGQAGKETGKFVVDTTVGIAGIMRPSNDMEALRTTDEDIGQAFGRWGMGHGFYIVIPFMGPSSLRDFVGDVADDAVEPLPEPWSLVDDSMDRILIRSVEVVNNLPALMELYNSMKRSAIDPYTSVRDAYAQRRARLVSE